MALDISKIIQYPLKADQFLNEEHPKSQIFIHHTAGRSSPYGPVDWWNSNSDRVGTAFVIAGKVKDKDSKWKDGDILQCFSSKKWAYHLGLKPGIFEKFNVPYKSLDKTSVAIEVCNWGYLKKQANGTFMNYVNGLVPVDEVMDLGVEYRGYRYYHKYTDAQIASLRDLLIYLCERYGIPKTYNGGMFEVNKDALSGKPGIWNHTSVRKDKTDMSPQSKLIDMLKTLETKPVIC